MRIKHVIIIGIVLVVCVLMTGCVSSEFLNGTQESVSPQETVTLDMQHNDASPSINYTFEKVIVGNINKVSMIVLNTTFL